MKNIAVTLFALLLLGCATAKGPQFQKLEQAPEDGSILYLYRGDFGTSQSAYTPNILINKTKVVALKRNAYSYIRLSPGTYTLSLRHNFLSGYPSLDAEFEISAGERKFIEVYDPVTPTHYVSMFKEIEVNQALIELKTKNYDPALVSSINK